MQSTDRMMRSFYTFPVEKEYKFENFCAHVMSYISIDSLVKWKNNEITSSWKGLRWRNL
jgi:hypothetical protein